MTVAAAAAAAAAVWCFGVLVGLFFRVAGAVRCKGGDSSGCFSFPTRGGKSTDGYMGLGTTHNIRILVRGIGKERI